jgi:hypothetical protein
VSALFIAWFAWRQFVSLDIVRGITAAAVLCLLYFEYTWSNSMFCRNHGLLGIMGRTLDHPDEVRHACYVLRLMDCCTLLHGQQPFNLYTAKRVCGGVAIDVPAALLDDWPWKDVDRSLSGHLFAEEGSKVVTAHTAEGITGRKNSHLQHVAARYAAKACEHVKAAGYPEASRLYSQAGSVVDTAFKQRGAVFAINQPGWLEVVRARADIDVAHAAVDRRVI